MMTLKSAALAACLLSAATGASAHATFEPREASIGQSYKAVLRVPHGCNGEATHTVRIDLPPELVAVKPMPKPGWRLETQTGPYPVPYNDHGRELREGVRGIVWSGGNLPDDQYDEFVFIGTIAPEAKGDQLVVPVTQVCASGEQHWTERAAPGQDAHQLKNPAPTIRLAAQEQPQPVAKLGDLVIAAPWTRATPAGAPVAGGYLKVTNQGKESDWLIGGTFPNARGVEVHTMVTENGVMQMRMLGDGLEIKPGETVELKPGGYHLMFVGLSQPVALGQPLKGTLLFRKAGSVAVEFTVAPIGAPGPAAGAHQHH
jgi:uncharacterized protein YcnI